MSSDALLQVRGLRKEFGGFRALDGVSLEVRPGQVMGLVGPNGSGKTTLINVVSGVYRPDGGEVLLRGAPISGLRPHEVSARGLNRTFQVPRPFSTLTVRENVSVAAQHSRRGAESVDEILEFIGLRSVAEREASTLNTAQQKILDLGRALATGPQILLVDELGAGLGPADLDAVGEKLRTLAGRGVALLVVEHLLGFLGALTQEVVVMNAGVEIFGGSLETAAQDAKVVEVFLGG